MSLATIPSSRAAGVVLSGVLALAAACGDDAGSSESGNSEGSTSTTTTATSSSSSGEPGESSSSGEASSSSEAGDSSTTDPYVPLDDTCAMSGTPCTDPDATKCTIVNTDTGGAELGCAAPTGDAGLEEACDFTGEPADRHTCGTELACVSFGSAEGQACRSICTDAVGCVEDASCVDFGALGAGACVPSCEPFAEGCGAEQKCAVATDLEGEPLGYCEAIGPGTQGEDCGINRDCGAGLACVAPIFGGVTCEIMCRSGVDGDCEEGVSCLPLLNTPGYGFCDPG